VVDVDQVAHAVDGLASVHRLDAAARKGFAMRIHVEFAIAAVLSMTAAIAPVAAQDHAHHATTANAQVSADGQRYATDAPLRKGMADIRVAVDALGHYERGHMGVDQALAEVATIERSIGGIIANCKLAPQADAALHGIIGTLGQGIAALKADPRDMAAIGHLREALQDYARLFDDAGATPGT
jgi:hypothetical protein